jgi:hypothetical protein
LTLEEALIEVGGLRARLQGTQALAQVLLEALEAVAIPMEMLLAADSQRPLRGMPQDVREGLQEAIMLARSVLYRAGGLLKPTTGGVH